MISRHAHRAYPLALLLAGTLMMNWLGPLWVTRTISPFWPSGSLTPFFRACILVFTLSSLRGHLMRKRQGFSKGKAVAMVVNEKGIYP